MCVAAALFTNPLLNADPIDPMADTWVATDAAGRVAPGSEECGPVRGDRWVGIFYWTWHHAGMPGPYDNSKILAAAESLTTYRRGGDIRRPLTQASMRTRVES